MAERRYLRWIIFLALMIWGMLTIAPPFFFRDARAAPSTSVVISQVYGGGGNSGATYKNDFIELFNRGNSTINLANWSVQYAAAAGSSWSLTGLSGSIAPGQYYLTGLWQILVEQHSLPANSCEYRRA